MTDEQHMMTDEIKETVAWMRKSGKIEDVNMFKITCECVVLNENAIDWCDMHANVTRHETYT